MAKTRPSQLILATATRRGRGWLVINTAATHLMPPTPVVYAIYQYGELLYIGQTVNLRRRFLTYRDRYECSYSKVCVVPDKGERLALERKLIRRVRPVQNHVFTGRPSRRHGTHVCALSYLHA